MYHPSSPSDEKTLLNAIGVRTFDDLIPTLPKKHVHPGLGLPKSLSEMENLNVITALSEKNGRALSFLGGGAYDHFIPSAVAAITSRGEFSTAYTPYQAEASQGTLQTIFEFQSMVAEIFGLEVANASLYDGGTALTEAAHVALRQTERSVLLVPDALHPHYRRVLDTYLTETGTAQIVTVACPNGILDQHDLDLKFSQHENNVAALLFQTPNFFGCLEDGSLLAKKAHAAGALFVVSANPVSLGLLQSPGEMDADIAVGDGQPLGMPLSYGGPYVGLFACKKEFMRKMPGRLCGQTVDVDGKPGFVLTLQAREQHIRREKANSNICTNQNLCATAFAIHTSLLGPDGLRELAELNLQLAHYAADQLSKISGYKMAFKVPFFNEFVLETPIEAELLHKKALDLGILAGFPLKSMFPTLTHHLLINVTEKKSKDDIDRLVSVLRSLA